MELFIFSLAFDAILVYSWTDKFMDELEERVNIELQFLSNWFKVNKLSLNFGKANNVAIERWQGRNNNSISRMGSNL